MAQATNFTAKTGVKVFFGTEATFGTPTVAVTGTWDQLPVVSYTIPETIAALDIGPKRAGLNVDFGTAACHRKDQAGFPFDITMYGTPTAVLKACQLMFEDGVSAATLAGNYQFPVETVYQYAQSSTSQMTVLFQGAGDDTTANDIHCISCVATGMQLKESLDSDAGKMMVTVNLITYFQPVHSNFGAPDTYASVYTLDTGSPKNIFSLATFDIDNGTARDLVPYEWEINFSRTVERVSYIDTTNWKPFGYVMGEGGITVTGSMVVKSDDNTNALLADYIDSGTVDINIAESSGFTIDIPTAMFNEPSKQLDDTFKNVYPFTAMGDWADLTSNVISITIA